VPRGIRRDARGRLAPLPGRALVVVGTLLGAGLTVALPIVIVVLVLAAVDLGLLIYWFYVRARPDAAGGRRVPRTPMRGLARALSAVGVVLIVNALWLTILGFLTEFGITNETMANWGGLAALGLQVTVDRPTTFGARCLVVAAAVWMVGFGLAKAQGENA
jgi:hypothetical protein